MTFREVFRRPLLIPLLVWIIGILVLDFFKAPLQIPNSLERKKQTHQGCLISNPDHQENNTRLQIQLASQPIVVRLTYPKPQTRFEQDFFKRGDCIEFDASLKIPTSFRNPGYFDYQKFLNRQGIATTAFVSDFKLIRKISESKPSFLNTQIPQFKSALLNQIGTLGFSDQAQAILAALLWGEERNLSKPTWTLFRDQGLAHLLVISGLHFTLLAWLTYHLSFRALKLAPKIFLTIPGPKLASLVTLLISTLYFFFCEPNPSITRAYLGIVVFLITLWINRPRDLPNTLFLAALMILILNPNDLFNASFQFSFLAVFSLIFIEPKIANWMHLEKISPFPKAILKLISVNLALTIGLMPIMVFYFYQIQLNGFWMNLWAVFYVEFFLVPTGLVALAISLISVSFGKILFSIPLAGIETLLQILEWSRLHFPKPFWVYPPHLWQLGVYYLAALFLLFEKRRWLKVAVVLLSLTAWISEYGYSYYSHQTNTQLKITQLDVGQGDSILIQTPGPHWILIDTGGSPYFEFGERVIAPSLLSQRIPKLDAVFITHADTDHYLGLPSLLPIYKIDRIFWNGVESKEMNTVWTEVSNRQIPLQSFQTHSIYSLTDKIQIRSLWPNGDLTLKDNDQSLVLRLDATLVRGKMSALFTGDLEKQAEEMLLEEKVDLDVDYLKIGHHGSKTSSHWEFLKVTSPQIATLGAGIQNRYGHPHRQVLQALKDANIPVFSTQENGAIETLWDGPQFNLQTFVRPPSETNP